MRTDHAPLLSLSSLNSRTSAYTYYIRRLRVRFLTRNTVSLSPLKKCQVTYNEEELVSKDSMTLTFLKMSSITVTITVHRHDDMSILTL